MIHRPNFDPRRQQELDAALRHASPSEVRHKMLMSPRLMPAGGGGGSSLSGVVTRTSDSAGVPNTIVQLFSSGGVLVDQTTTNGSGAYSFGSYPAGAVARCHPPSGYCIADAGEFAVAGATQNFSTQIPPVPWKAQLTEGSGISIATLNNGTLAPAPWGNNTNTDPHSTYGLDVGVTVNATGGPNGQECLEYNFADRTANCGGFTQAYQPRISGFTPTYTSATPDLVNGEIWLVCKDWYSLNWVQGDQANCGLLAYKHFLVRFDGPTGGTNSRLGFYWGGSTPTDFFLVSDWTPAGANAGTGFATTNVTNLGNISNQYSTWVIGITGMGSASTVAKFYRNGTLLYTTPTCNINPTSAPFGSAWGYALELGANINNGPTQAQTRRIWGWGLYPTRPGLV